MKKSVVDLDLHNVPRVTFTVRTDEQYDGTPAVLIWATAPHCDEVLLRLSPADAAKLAKRLCAVLADG